MNERDWIVAEWLLGVFGTATMFFALALMGSAAQGELMGWFAWLLGVVAFGIMPAMVVALRPRRLTGGMMGIGITIGAIALVLIIGSLYGIMIPPIVLLTALILGFFSGAMGEPWAGTAWR